MSFHAFKVLVDMLYENISNDYLRYGLTSTQVPIRAEIIVAIGLCWLAGASYVDLKIFATTVLPQFTNTETGSYVPLICVIP